MIDRKNWDDFRKTGLVLFINQFLHIFGWAIVFEINNETKEVVSAYPARVKFRGFDGEDQSEAYVRLTDYMAENSEELQKEVD